MRYSIQCQGTEEFFSVVAGRVAWEGLAASCDSCGCDIHTGRRTAETDKELRARLCGKRAKVADGALACVNCGREYPVREEPEDA